MTHRHLHVLLVEDDDSHAELIEHSLTHQHRSTLVTRARDVRHARQLLRTSAFDAAVVDLQLAGGSGLNLLRAGTMQQCAFIVLTSGGDEGSAVKAIKAGAIDSVLKSFASIEALPRIVDRARREFRLRRERHDAQQALRRSEQRYRLLLEDVEAVVWEFDLTARRFTFVSQKAEQLLGYPLHRWYERFFWHQRVHPDDRETTAALARDRAASLQGYDVEYRLLHADGHVVWVRDLTGPAHQDGDTPTLHGVMFDVTERKGVEARMRRTETHLATLLEQTTFVLYEFSPDANFFSDNIISLTGFTAQLHMAANALLPSLVSPRDRVRLLHQTKQWYDRGATGELVLQYRLRRRDGAWRWVEDRRFQVRGPHGERIISGVLLDITDQKSAEEQMRFQATLLDSVRESVIASDLDGHITYWGKGAENLYGYRAEEVLGKNVTKIVSSEEMGEERRRMAEAFKNGYWTGEYRQHRKDGRAFWADVRIALITNADGKATGFLGVDRDITPAKEAEQALRESERRFRQLAESIDEAFFLLFPDERRLLYANPAWTRMVGQPEDLLRTQWNRWMDCLHPDDRTRVQAAASLRGQGIHDDVRNEELRFRRADGSSGWMWIRSRPVRNEQGRIVARAGVAADVTERRRAEEEARRQAETERLLRRELNHRIRNMLAALVSLADLMASSEPGAERFATAIGRRISMMASTHSILSESRWQPVSLPSLLESIITPGAAAMMDFEGPEIDVPPGQVQALGMIVNELITNSAKYGALSRPHGRTLVRWVKSDTSDGMVRLCLYWEERGGPPIEELPEPGVGLSLVRGFVCYELCGDLELRFPREGASHRLEFVLGQGKGGAEVTRWQGEKMVTR